MLHFSISLELYLSWSLHYVEFKLLKSIWLNEMFSSISANCPLALWWFRLTLWKLTNPSILFGTIPKPIYSITCLNFRNCPWIFSHISLIDRVILIVVASFSDHEGNFQRAFVRWLLEVVRVFYVDIKLSSGQPSYFISSTIATIYIRSRER